MTDDKTTEFEQQAIDGSGNFLTDETITQEQINEMKMLGLPKPDTVSWERWNQLQNYRIEHQHMVRLAAAGWTQGAIAKELGYTQTHVSKVLNTPEVKEEVSALMNEIYGQDFKKALKERGHNAVRALDEIMETGKNSEKIQVAQYFLDHTIGKASQTVEHKGTILADVMVQIEQLRNVTPDSALLTEKPSKFDNIIEAIVPSGVVVGKRTESEE